MIKDLVDTVTGWRKARGKTSQPPASEEAIRALRQRSQAELGADIPDEYADLLRQANGIDWNGLSIYATEKAPVAGREGERRPRFVNGFVEQSQAWHGFEPARNSLVFGHSGNAIYTYHRWTGSSRRATASRTP